MFVRRTAPLVVMAVIVIGYGYVRSSEYGLAQGVNICVAAIAAVGLTLTIGGAGQLALGQAGFMAIGGYGTAYLMKAEHVTFVLAVLTSCALALIVGALVGYIALRLRGNYLAMATLAVGSGIYALLNVPSRFGGASGYFGIPLPKVGEYTFYGSLPQFLLVAIVLVGVLVGVRLLLASRTGSELAAIRDDEVAAGAVGVNVTARKVQVFAISSAIGALAGGIGAPIQTAIDPSSYSPDVSLQLFVMVVLGGLGSIYGAVLGAALVTWLITATPSSGTVALTILGAVVVVFMAALPGGLSDVPSQTRALWQSVRRFREERSAPVSSTTRTEAASR
jgi:branched-chain amino acid transport system permease protein